MKTTDELVRELADREAIRDLPIRYCHCIGRKDIQGLVSLFTDDGTFVVKGLEVEAVSRGRSELMKVYQKAIGELEPRLYVHNHLVELRGANRATGRCNVEVRSAKLGMQSAGAGCYEDEYEKVGEEWKFASRRYTSEGIDTQVWLRTFIV
jgi:ketosteroid isomerase-like protein